MSTVIDNPAALRVKRPIDGSDGDIAAAGLATQQQ
jgi:hypothetical protein